MRGTGKRDFYARLYASYQYRPQGSFAKRRPCCGLGFGTQCGDASVGGHEGTGVTWSAAHVTPGDADATVDAFRKSLRPNTKLMICTHASNVFGIRLPVRRLAALAHAYGVLFAVDAAQSAGVLPLHLREDGIDFICAAGHKGLFGPMGTGLLITEKETYCGRFARVEQEAFPLVCSSLTPCPIDSKAAHKMFPVSAGFRPVLILC